MEKLYNSILQQIKNEVKEIKFIDFDTGQIDNPEDNYIVSFPAVLIGFNYMDFAGIGGGIVAGETSVNIRVIFQIWEDINSLTPSKIYKEGVKRFQLANKVFKALEGLTGDNFNALQLGGTTPETRPNLHIITNTFNTHVFKWDAKAETVDKQPPTELKFKKPFQ